MRLLLAVAVLAALARPARADEPPEASEIMLVPAECMAFWSIPGGSRSPAAWDAVVSFASCIQDRTIYVVDRAEQLPAFVDHLQAALGPALQFYAAALDEAPDGVKLRAAYYIGAGQVALITRARLSLTTPKLRPALDRLLEPHAQLAYSIFTGLERVAASDPRLAQDVVIRYMVRSAHELALQLQRSWSIPVDDRPLRILPR
jgi:hypothetical protein